MKRVSSFGSNGTTAGDPRLWGYAVEKLGDTVTVLAIHPEEVRRRLLFAFEHLAQVPVTALPNDLRGPFISVMERLTKDGADYRGRSRVSLNLRRMRKATGQKLAAHILSVYQQLEVRDR